jgi:uncharacterized protein YggU (UPF0235/DUF167 family)
MIGREFRFHDGEKGAALAIRVSQDKTDTGIIKVLNDGTLLVNLSNDDIDIDNELVKYLADLLGVAKKRLDIIAGGEDNERLVSILDMKPSEVQTLILEVIDR